MPRNDSSFQVTTDQSRLDLPMIYCFLREQSTWVVGISRPVIERAIDLLLLAQYRGHGYGKQLINAVLEHPGPESLMERGFPTLFS
jgi:GNAT superfamily N-acetyltransferase